MPSSDYMGILFLHCPLMKTHTQSIASHYFSVWKKNIRLITPKCQYNTGRQYLSGPYFHLHSCFLHVEMLGSAYHLSLQIHMLAAGSLNPLFFVFKVFFRSYFQIILISGNLEQKKVHLNPYLLKHLLHRRTDMI